MSSSTVTNKHLDFTLTFEERRSGRENSFAEGGGDCETPGKGGVERGEGGEYLADEGCVNGNDICEDGRKTWRGKSKEWHFKEMKTVIHAKDICS